MNTLAVRGNNNATEASEWGSARLELETYLRRVAYPGDRAPTVANLRRLHRAHVFAIPFENLDIVLGRTIPLDIDSLQRKLVRRRRGGYCYEHNLLFAALLERLGYGVIRLVGRVQPNKPGPRTHMLLRVEAEGSHWLADVGFGGEGLVEPLPLEDTVVERQGGRTYRLERVENGSWLLRILHPEGWFDLYTFTLEPHAPIDYAVYNHYTATHPASPFVRHLVAQQAAPKARHILHGRRLTSTNTDGTIQQHVLTTSELAITLEDIFGIALEPEEAAGLAWVTDSTAADVG